MVAPPVALVEHGESVSRLQSEQGFLDNGQYLDIRGVTELDTNADSNSSTNTTTNTSATMITTTATAAENSSSSTPNHSKFKSPDQHSKGPVQFDQPNRWNIFQLRAVYTLCSHPDYNIWIRICFFFFLTIPYLLLICSCGFNGKWYYGLFFALVKTNWSMVGPPPPIITKRINTTDLVHGYRYYVWAGCMWMLCKE